MVNDKRNWNGTWFPQNPNAAIKKLESFQKTLIDVNENNNATGVWKGKWFPHEPHPDAEPLKHEKTQLKKHPDLIKMGVADPVCDDGNTNLATDFDPNDVTFHEEFLCTRPFKFKEFKPNKTRKAHHLSYNIPKGYRFNHICMNETIEYKENIPTYGDHRKLWAAWGEYKFLPKQRWIHNLEHGGIVMLYHPCALQYEVQKLKDIVANCLYRHIITPYSDLTAERPLALVAWENSVEMSVVSTEIAVSFIRKYALQAPEKLPDQGQYQHMLIKNSTIISDYNDSRLCPYQLELNGDKNGPF
uniref:CSON001827 protein n=1 Tax=Culicoides sonorensis TaxID=179676 RepID=A0A336MHI8_CULSO